MNKIHTLADRIGITLTPMQETVADRLLHTDRNVVVLSPTGSGKTFAYLLPLVAMIDATRQEVQAVVVVPGRELALQSQQVLESMRTGLRSMAVYGGRPTMEEHRKMREVRPQVVFARRAVSTTISTRATWRRRLWTCWSSTSMTNVSKWDSRPR